MSLTLKDALGSSPVGPRIEQARGGAATATATPTDAPSPAAKDDAVSLTRQARDVLGLAGQTVGTAAADPPINRTRVAELRSRIAAGEYVIDPVKIAQQFTRLDAQLGLSRAGV